MESVAQARWRQAIRRSQHLILLGGALLAPLLLLAAPSWRATTIATLLIGVYLLFRRLVVPLPIVRKGRIYDEKSGKAISGVIVRLLDKRSGVLAERQVTDRHGRDGFHAGKNVYSLAVDASGYLPVTLVDVIPVEAEGVISRDIAMTRDVQKRKGTGLVNDRVWKWIEGRWEQLLRLLSRRPPV
jgi:hypothetical protein